MNKFVPPYTITPDVIVVFIEGKALTVNSGDDRYTQCYEAIREENFDLIPTILDVKGRLISESNGGLYLLNGMLRSDSYSIPALLATRIIEMFKNGFNISPLTMFLENLMSNPNESGSIVEEVYSFIEKCNLPITADGHFLAYKMVSTNFKDLYTGKMDNSVGAKPEMDRAKCDFNRGQTCSTGLHFCSEGYLGHYGSKGSSQVVVVKVNPRDVTSIPNDYNDAKGRACQYEIVDAIPWDEFIKPLFTEEYSEVELGQIEDVEVDDTEIPFDDGINSFRWEVRLTSDNSIVDLVVTRQEARDLRNSVDDSSYIWDSENKDVVAGVRDWSLDAPTVKPNPSAKLNDSTVGEIRKILEEKAYDTLESLAMMYGVTSRTIRRIRDWESWTHVSAK